MQFNFDHPNAIAALGLFETIMGPERLWAYDISDPSNLWDWGRNFNSWTEGRTVFWGFVVWNLAYNVPVMFNYDIVPYPLGPNNTSGNSWASNLPQSWGIPRNTYRPEDVFIIFEEQQAWPWG